MTSQNSEEFDDNRFKLLKTLKMDFFKNLELVEDPAVKRCLDDLVIMFDYQSVQLANARSDLESIRDYMIGLM